MPFAVKTVSLINLHVKTGSVRRQILQSCNFLGFIVVTFLENHRQRQRSPSDSRKSTVSLRRGTGMWDMGVGRVEEATQRNLVDDKGPPGAKRCGNMEVDPTWIRRKF